MLTVIIVLFRGASLLYPSELVALMLMYFVGVISNACISMYGMISGIQCNGIRNLFSNQPSGIFMFQTQGNQIIHAQHSDS
jgi:hypothetical protein